MNEAWLEQFPSVIVFVLGLGALAAAALAILRLWRAVVPNTTHADIKAIKDDMHVIRKRVGVLEKDVAKLDHETISKRFDGIEGKIDKLFAVIIEHLATKKD